MNKPHLAACPACVRHVRVDETACPFCGAVLGASFAGSPEPVRPAVRLSRAALAAFGAGTFGIVTACSSVGSMPPYGASPIIPPPSLDDSGANPVDSSTTTLDAPEPADAGRPLDGGDGEASTDGATEAAPGDGGAGDAPNDG